MTRLPLACSLALASCTETIRLDHDPLDNLESVEIFPSDATVQIMNLGEPFHSLQYEAMGRFSDGSTRDITPLVAWTLDRQVLGGFGDRGLFVASHEAAGRATVRAAIRDFEVSSPLTVMVDATIIDPVYPPPGANLFDPDNVVVTGDPTRSPTLIYPSDGTVLPEKIASTLFQLDPGASNDAFRITFKSELLQIRVETAADRWRADGTVQRLLSAAADDQPLVVEISATSSGNPATLYAGRSIELEFSRDLGDTSLFFWSSATNGIMRSSVDINVATKLEGPSGSCVGCHTISRNGASLAFATDNGTSSELQVLDLMSSQTTIQPSPTRPMGWAAYSPDGARLIVAHDGVLTHYDATTGASLGIVPLPPQRYATHPDWSPDGRALVVALTSLVPTNKDVRAASIAVLPYTNGVWGAPQTIVAGSMTNNNYFPRYSPDGSLIAFVNATTSSRGALSAELVLVPAGGGPLRWLQIANQRVGPNVGGNLANTMPSWAPQIGARLWLGFASARPYGKLNVGGPGQIWITSLDLTSPADPSTPAFWLPSQDVTVLNYNPIWSNQAFTTL